MNTILNDIYKTWNNVLSNENISYKTIKISDDILNNLDYHPNYIWNTQGNIILEYNHINKTLFIIINDYNVTGKLCIDTKLEYVYLTCENINTILDTFWE